jgi:hypothetical protein
LDPKPVDLPSLDHFKAAPQVVAHIFLWTHYWRPNTSMYRCVTNQTFFVGYMEEGAVIYTSIVRDTSACCTSIW